MPPVPKQWKLHFDGTVTAGNLILAATLLVGIMIWGMRLESMVTQNNFRIERNEAALITLSTAIASTVDATETRLVNQISELRRVLLSRFNNNAAQ